MRALETMEAHGMNRELLPMWLMHTVRDEAKKMVWGFECQVKEFGLYPVGKAISEDFVCFIKIL